MNRGKMEEGEREQRAKGKRTLTGIESKAENEAHGTEG
jgi:hypothetical protein